MVVPRRNIAQNIHWLIPLAMYYSNNNSIVNLNQYVKIKSR